MTLPVVPDGEDKTSFERHNRVIRAELKKTRPNATVLKDIISRSYAMRRIDVLENSYSLTEVFDKYPFLADPDQVWLIFLLYQHHHYFDSNILSSSWRLSEFAALNGYSSLLDRPGLSSGPLKF